ncbi:MAG TPA: ATP-dependent Clp protease proteolytic subunit [Bacillota bacterium]
MASTSWSNIIWIALIIWTFLNPWLRQRAIGTARFRALRRLEVRRGTRVITLIHRQEALSLFGIQLAKFIDIEDSEAVLRAIRLTPEDMPIDIILHTPGGLVLAAEQIALAVQKHKGKVTCLVPHYAMSGGTLLALAADEIMMDENAVLGPVDPQIGEYPAASILEVTRIKKTDEIDDKTLILADVSKKAMRQVKEAVTDLLKKKRPADEAERIADELTKGQWTHDYPITFEKLQAMGLPVQVGLPVEVYEMMDLYPQPATRRPSVQYVPIPYDGAERGKKK